MTDVGVHCLYTVINKCQSTESVILQVHPTFTPPRPEKDQKKNQGVVTQLEVKCMKYQCMILKRCF